MAQDVTTDLVAATNELTRILVQQELTGGDFRAVTGIACKALNNLYASPAFDHAFQSLQSRAEQESAPLASIVTEVDHFTKHFLRTEFSLLEHEFKIDACMLGAVKAAAHEVREAVNAEQPQLLVIKQRIASLRDDACALSADLKRVLDAPARRNRLTRYALGSLGGVTILADNAPIALSYLSPAGTAASWKLGSGLIAIGGTGLYEKVLTKIGAALS